jgi:hypothetical protein
LPHCQNGNNYSIQGKHGKQEQHREVSLLTSADVVAPPAHYLPRRDLDEEKLFCLIGIDLLATRLLQGIILQIRVINFNNISRPLVKPVVTFFQRL